MIRFNAQLLFDYGDSVIRPEASQTKIHADGSREMYLKDGTRVVYDPEGFIEFAPDSVAIDHTTVPIGSKSNYQDFKAANQWVRDNMSPEDFDDPYLKEFFFDPDKTPTGAPDDFTWHHHQDTGRMQLVDDGVHGDAPHTGGASIWGKSEPRYDCDPVMCDGD